MSNLDIIFGTITAPEYAVQKPTMYYIKHHPHPNSFAMEVEVADANPDTSYDVSFSLNIYDDKSEKIPFKINFGDGNVFMSEIKSYNPTLIEHLYPVKGGKTYIIEITDPDNMLLDYFYLNIIIYTSSRATIKNIYFSRFGQYYSVNDNKAENEFYMCKDGEASLYITRGYPKRIIYSEKIHLISVYIDLENVPDNNTTIIIYNPYNVIVSADPITSAMSNKIYRVYVPDNLVNSYKANSMWSELGNKIQPLSQMYIEELTEDDKDN